MLPDRSLTGLVMDNRFADGRMRLTSVVLGRESFVWAIRRVFSAVKSYEMNVFDGGGGSDFGR